MNRTKIEYLTHTWNPIAMRCTPVSEGCEHCWHLAMCKRHAGNPSIGGLDILEAKRGGPPVLMETELIAPLHKRKPARIGVQFMGDLFHRKVSRRMLAEIMDVMASWRIPKENYPAEEWNHTFIVLTKRPERVIHALDAAAEYAGDHFTGDSPWNVWLEGMGSFLPESVWLGVTAENQARADERIPVLLEIPAAVRFVSIEPMLGSIETLSFYLSQPNAVTEEYRAFKGIDWVIVGGESGPGARPMTPDWARDVRDQCQAAGVPFYMKQMSAREPIPDDLMIRQFPQGERREFDDIA